MDSDTIVAIATPPGYGGIGIVRLSGPEAAGIAARLAGPMPAPRYAAYRTFRAASGEAIDDGLLLYFPGPGSFTGEDVVELQGHGGPVVLDWLVDQALAHGARHAEPGEFSRRAFLNDRLDLTQAESIADLIHAATRDAARGARQSLAGAFSERIEALLERLTALRVYIEGAIDFPDDEVELLADGAVLERLDGVLATLAELDHEARRGLVLTEGMTLVLAGRPNVGKSSLLNRLAARERAIVTEVPGTTRDLLRERVSIDGMPLTVVDTAGLRESGNRIEQEGVRRARAAAQDADRILLVVDASAGIQAADTALLDDLPGGPDVTVVANKIDLAAEPPPRAWGEAPVVAVSALTGEGLDQLRDHLKSLMGWRVGGESGFTARRRHLDALARVQSHAEAARGCLASGSGAELAAEELREAQNALGEITGALTPDDLLGRIFTTFCIGK